MAKKTRKQRLCEEISRDIARSLPAVVLSTSGDMLAIACSRNPLKLIKRALDRVIVLGFGSEGRALQDFAIRVAKNLRRSGFAFEDITPIMIATKVAKRLQKGLKNSKIEEIYGALVIGGLDIDGSQGDEIIVVNFDGSLMKVAPFVSGVTFEEDENDDTIKDKKNSTPTKESSATIGQPMPKMLDWIESPQSRNFHVVELILAFARECEERLGENFFIHFVDLDREAAQAGEFASVFREQLIFWPAMKQHYEENPLQPESFDEDVEE